MTPHGRTKVQCAYNSGTQCCAVSTCKWAVFGSPDKPLGPESRKTFSAGLWWCWRPGAALPPVRKVRAPGLASSTAAATMLRNSASASSLQSPACHSCLQSHSAPVGSCSTLAGLCNLSSTFTGEDSHQQASSHMSCMKYSHSGGSQLALLMRSCKCGLCTKRGAATLPQEADKDVLLNLPRKIRMVD